MAKAIRSNRPKSLAYVTVRAPGAKQAQFLTLYRVGPREAIEMLADRDRMVSELTAGPTKVTTKS